MKVHKGLLALGHNFCFGDTLQIWNNHYWVLNALTGLLLTFGLSQVSYTL